MIATGDPLFVDLSAIETGEPSWPLPRALSALGELYAALDARLLATTRDLAIPCKAKNDTHDHCSICCHESVFLTPLEWFFVVDYIQKNFTAEQLAPVIHAAHAIYDGERERIDAFLSPPPAGARDHFSVAKTLRFTCPLLVPGGCSIYPARELFGRLFGAAFNADGGIYGCHLSGAFFGDRVATLVSTPAWAEQVRMLPLTHYRQVYPYWFALTWPR